MGSVESGVRCELVQVCNCVWLWGQGAKPHAHCEGMAYLLRRFLGCAASCMAVMNRLVTLFRGLWVDLEPQRPKDGLASDIMSRSLDDSALFKWFVPRV